MAKRRTVTKKKQLEAVVSYAEMPVPVLHKSVPVSVAGLTPHPRNYQTHPDDQLEHLVASIKEHGFYRNVVVARGVILAGHGAVEAAKRAGLEEIPAVCLDIDPNSPQALKIIAADNEISRLASVNDRGLTDLLKEIGESDPFGLLGTGFDEMQLAALAMVTRDSAEIEGFDAAAEWAGADMPEFSTGVTITKMIIQFRSEGDREEFAEKFGIVVNNKVSAAGGGKYTGRTWSAWWPERAGNDDLRAVKWEGEEEGEGEEEA